MENEKVIVRADIRRTPQIIVMVIWYILGAIAFCIGTFGMSTSETYSGGDDSKHYYLFFLNFYSYYKHVFRERTSENEYFYVSSLLLGILIIIGIIVLPIIMHKIADYMARQCSLSLTEKSVTGNKKTLFSNKLLKLPIDKVDAIMASHSFLDTLRGGDTLLIRSASGVIKFPWVQNANDFVNKTLAKIEEYKQSVKNENKNLVSAVLNNTANNSNSDGLSSAARIKELKDLLDSGLITQEEFDSKRKELLNKM